MKSALLSTILVCIMLAYSYCQNTVSDIDSYMPIDVKEMSLREMGNLIDSLINIKDRSIKDLLEEYQFQALDHSDRFHIGKAYSNMVFFMDYNDEVGISEALDKALLYLNKQSNQLQGEVWVEELVKLELIHGKQLIITSDKDTAMALHYHLIDVIDSLSDKYSEFSRAKYHALNYFYIANAFLFDDDEISTRYADSVILWSYRYGDPSRLFSAYSMKYYTRYFNNDGFELNNIADSCIKYALITDVIKDKGEAYMHKCNALVVLDEPQEGMSYCDRALAEYEQLKDSSYLSSTLHNMGNVFKKVGDKERTLHYYKKALGYDSKKDKSSYYNSMEAIASELYDSGDFREAAKYYNDFSKGYYKFYQDQLTSKFSEAEAKYQSDIKETEIVRQELLIESQESARKSLIALSLGGFGLVGALFFGFYQRTKRRNQKDALALELEKDRARDLEKISKIKTDFFNNVSHELRTPLTLVIAPLEDAIKKVKNVDLLKDLSLSLSNSKRLLNLTNEILDLSKIDASKLQLDLSNINLRSFLNRVYHSFDSLANTRNIALLDEVPQDLNVIIQTDANKLEKIITNLASNALKYSDNSSKVILRLEEMALDNDQLILHVQDEGTGISIHDQQKIFDRYYQSDATSHAAGTGIGLALVKELVGLLDGSIDMDSALGKGSTFKIVIPVLVIDKVDIDIATPISQDDVISYEPIFIKGDKPTILIVEDDLDMSKYLVSLLQSEYQCEVAYNGQQAFEKVNANSYDLITSDIMMPEMDGFQFRNKLNHVRDYASIPFIMLSARMLEEDKLRGFQLGIDDYITKPFSSKELKARVYSLLKNKISRDEYQLEEDEKNCYDKDFIATATKMVLDHLDDPAFKVDQLAIALNYSKRQLGRILKNLTGLSTVNFILEIRLQKAYQLIEKKKYTTLNEVRYDIGIESASYFSTKFKKRFGISPGEVIAK